MTSLVSPGFKSVGFRDIGSPAGVLQPVPGAIAYYRFDEGLGQILHDYSGNGNHGTLGSTAGVDTNDPQWSPQGLVFGGDDLVDISSIIPKLQGLASFTLQFVVSSTVDTAFGGIIGAPITGFRDRVILNVLNYTEGEHEADFINVAVIKSNGVYSEIDIPGRFTSTPTLITIRYQGGVVLEGRKNQGSWVRNTTNIISNLNPAVTNPKLYLGKFAELTFLTGGLNFFYLHPGFIPDEQLAGNYSYIKSYLAQKGVILP